MENKIDLKEQVREFLIDANLHGYAVESTARVKEKDHSTTITYENGDWKFHDNYFGGEPYGGREVIFYKGKPVFIMVYYGYIIKEITYLKEIYKFLQKALSIAPEKNPYRGPKLLESDNHRYRYENKWTGEIDDFSGEEMIFLDGRRVYAAKYMGGLLDQREE